MAMNIKTLRLAEGADPEVLYGNLLGTRETTPLPDKERISSDVESIGKALAVGGFKKWVKGFKDSSGVGISEPGFDIAGVYRSHQEVLRWRATNCAAAIVARALSEQDQVDGHELQSRLKPLADAAGVVISEVIRDPRVIVELEEAQQPGPVDTPFLAFLILSSRR
jgi:hypothetical protein